MSVWRCVGAVVLVWAAQAGPAAAADARFERVLVLPSPDRVSVVFELTTEPADVATRRVSAAVFELEAGPVALPLEPTTLASPAGVRFVGSVAIQGVSSGSAGVLKARITLLERSRSAVRVAGRRVYVDFMAGEPPRHMGEEIVERPVRLPAPRDTASRLPPAREAARREAAAAPPPAAYRTAVQPLIDRLDELRPFLLSAAASPSLPVLQALGGTLTEIRQSLRALDVPPEAREPHRLLSLAIEQAMTAVDPLYAGDRAGQVTQALALVGQARLAL